MLIMGGLSVLPICSPSADQFNFHHEGVLGTSLDLSIESDSIITAGNAEAYALKEIERLSEIFSSYSDSSELSQWLQTQNEPVVVSKELSAVFEMMDRWQEVSDGAFSPAIAELAGLWSTAAKTGRTPDTEAIRTATKSAK